MSDSSSSTTGSANSISQYKIPKEDLELGDTIGSGGFGWVYKGKVKGKECAIKSVYLPKQARIGCSFDETPDEKFKEIVNEIRVMMRLEHHCVLQCYGWAEDENCIYIVMELMPFNLSKFIAYTNPEYYLPHLMNNYKKVLEMNKGSGSGSNKKDSILGSTLRTGRKRTTALTNERKLSSPKEAKNMSIDEKKYQRGSVVYAVHESSKASSEDKVILSNLMKLQIVTDIAESMHYLHTRPIPIIHRDLKSDNVLLSGNMTSKICDFGFAKINANQSRALSGFKGTTRWMAPESFTGSPTGRAADVYSFGMLLYELVMHKEPFYQIENEMQIPGFALKGLQPDIQNEDQIKQDPIVGMLIKILRQCIQLDPTKRPTFAQIIQALEAIKIPEPDPINVAQEGEADFKSIQQAIDSISKKLANSYSSDSDISKMAHEKILKNTRPLRPWRIDIQPGVYKEPILIDQDVFLNGITSKSTKVIIEKSRMERIVMMFEGTRKAKVKNLWIHDPNYKRNRNAPGIIRFTGRGQNILERSYIRGITIEIDNDANPTIHNCTITGSRSKGIHINDFGRGTITYNDISRCTFAGISILKYADPIIMNNCIHDNFNDGIVVSNSARGLIQHNEICDNDGNGILVAKSADPTVKENNVHDNDFGIVVESQAAGQLIRNEVYNNGEEEDEQIQVGKDCATYLHQNITE